MNAVEGQVNAMLEFQTARTNPHPEIDLLTRIRLLELQVAAVADAVRAVAEILEEETLGERRIEVTKRVADLLDEAKVPRL
jgi:hypothetical protein